MRVLVCGGRDWTDTEATYKFLDRLQRNEWPIDVIIEGDARGADRMAGYWARKRGIHNLKFRADWKKHGRAAGPIRNKQMLEEGRPDLVVAFPGGSGTENMVKQAKETGVTVFRAPSDQPWMTVED